MSTALVLVWFALSGDVARLETTLGWSAAIAIAHLLLVILPPYGLGAGDFKLVTALIPVIAWWGGIQIWLWLWFSYSGAAIYGLIRRNRGFIGPLAFGPWLVTAWIVIVMGDLARVAMVNCW